MFFCIFDSGKNDGTVKGIKYFEAKPKHGIFVRVDKLIQDRRGRAMRMSLYDKSQKGWYVFRVRYSFYFITLSQNTRFDICT